MSSAPAPLVLNVRGGARLCVPAALDQITTYVLLEQEDWFEDEIRFVRRWLQRGMRAVDVGANIGVYTVAMAQAVGSSGRVWAFEPTPAAADYLQHGVGLNGFENVVVSRAAVSDREGTVAFSVGNHPELNAVAKPGSAGGDTLQVRAITLDRMAAEHGWATMDLVKLDVEGHESEAIRGGAKFLASASPVLMLEVMLGGRVDLGVLDLVVEMGYDVYRLLPGPLMLTPFDHRFEQADQYLLNVFACKRDRAGRLATDGLLAGSDAAELAAPEKDAWDRYLHGAPYARELAAGWPAKAGYFSTPDRRTYAEGLNAFALSRDEGRDPAERLAWLSRAFQCVAEALDAGETLARRISFARLAWELGQRGAAVDALHVAAERVAAQGRQALAEPFLAPSQRYEQLAVGASPAEWLNCAVVEQFEKLRYFSSIFSGMSSHTVLEPIRDLPFRSAEMDRRWELVRMKSGGRAAPRSVAALCARSEENLNPQFWSGPERVALEARRYE